MRAPDAMPGEDDGLLADINVTPFIDVMLVLLIVFMVAAPLMMSGVPLSLPKAAAAPLPPPQEPLVVSMDKDGARFVGDRRVNDAELEAELARVASTEPGRAVHVRCDRSLDYGRIMDLLGLVGRAGVGSVALVAEGGGGVPAPAGRGSVQ